MLKLITQQLGIAIRVLLCLTLLTGLVYPFLVTGLSQVLFPWQANGSFIVREGKIIGSQLIGQVFSDPKYFWGRPSATTPFAYNAQNSSGSYLGPSNPEFFTEVKKRIDHFHSLDPTGALIPIDLVTASGSGLDPEISPAAAFYQVARIAKTRGISEEEVKEIIQKAVSHRTFKILGEPRVNVLQLNLQLDHRNDRHDTHSPQPR